MRVSNITLILVVALSVYCTTQVYYGAWARDYDSTTAKAKMEYLWNKITADTSPSSFPSILGLMKLAGPEMLGGLNFWVTGDTVSDQFPEGRFKGIHSVGKIAKCKFNWDAQRVKDLGLTGAFTESEDNCLVRASSGIDPNRNKVPNMAIKVLRDGVRSANIFAGAGLAGSKDVNFFLNPLANHVANRPVGFSSQGAEAALFNLVFTKGPDMHGITGLSEFGQYTKNGTKSDKIKVPFTLVYEQFPATKKFCEGKPLEGQNFGCFKEMKENTTLYNLYVVMNPILASDLTAADVIPIGTISSTTKWVSSKFADEQLFFKHTFWPQEMKLLANTPAKAKWEAKVTQKFMDTESPKTYIPFFTSNRGRVVKRRMAKLEKAAQVKKTPVQY